MYRFPCARVERLPAWTERRPLSGRPRALGISPARVEPEPAGTKRLRSQPRLTTLTAAQAETTSALLAELPPLEGALPGLLQHALPLLGGRALPLLTQLLTTLRWQALEPAEVIPHDLLLLRRQRAELLPALPQHLPRCRRQLLPALEALTRGAALCGRHVQPALAAVRERLLAIGRQAAPLRRVSGEQPLLCGGERGPGHGTRLRECTGLLRKDRHCRDEQQRQQSDVAGVPHCF